MEWIINNWEAVFVAVTSLVAAASAIANLTPTDSDNKVIERLTKLVDALALNFKKPAGK